MPPLTGVRSLSAPAQLRPGRAASRVAGLSPMVSMGCLQNCVGGNANSYYAQCSSDLDCWRRVAPDGASCVSQCFAASSSVR
ncbi:MAG: hypothetical protein H6741_20080 [Alphaproteobacteria bacterium]|nr:hypothetical protein [Alphaproteobacteria bacterium]